MSPKQYVIVGAGHAARRAAETLRAQDAESSITVIGEEPVLPYDRPVLSKAALTHDDGLRQAFIRDATWYAAQRIMLRLNTRVTAIDRARRHVTTHSGESLPYDALLLATGSRIRPFPGHVDAGIRVHYVRTAADAAALRRSLTQEDAGRPKRVAVLGGGFIGLEVASSARALGCHVTVFESGSRLLGRSMPSVVGVHLASLHRTRGVDLRFSTTVTALRHGEGAGIDVETGDGVVTVDVVVVGIGVVPNVELAQQAGLQVDNGIVVDAQCRTDDTRIFAAGEVTSHFNPLLGRRLRVESWQVAENQPAVAAQNMLGVGVGVGVDYAEVPWLWSDQYDCNVQTLGTFDDIDADAARDRLVLRGAPETGAFVLFALDDADRLRAAATVNAGREMAVCRRLLAAGKVLVPTLLADETRALRSLL